MRFKWWVEMAGDQLADDLARWHDIREVVRISADVDPVYEIAAITDRLTRTTDGGPALLFDHVRGHAMPVVTNLLGSPRRIASAFDVPSLDRLSSRIDEWLATSLPRGMVDVWKLLPKLAELSNCPPATTKTGLCQQVVKLGRDVNLAELPVLTSWPGESAPCITWGQLHTRRSSRPNEVANSEPDLIRHVCVVPLEVRGRDNLLVHFDEQSELWQLLADYRAFGKQMPVAVVFGGDPITMLSSWAPRPPRLDALTLAGFLRNRPVELVAARTVPLEVLASAEIVIEGFIDPQNAWELAGPIAREAGFLGQIQPAPAIRVTAITHRANPVFTAMVHGQAPAESHWLDRASERLLLPMARLWIPELVNWRLPFAGATRHLAFVSIRKSYAQQARKVMHALWSLPRFCTSKMLVLVDEDVDVADENAVWTSVAAHADPARDLVLWDGPADVLDHATATRGVGRKLGIDATTKRRDESATASAIQPLSWTAEIAASLQVRWPEFGLEALLCERR